MYRFFTFLNKFYITSFRKQCWVMRIHLRNIAGKINWKENWKKPNDWIRKFWLLLSFIIIMLQIILIEIKIKEKNEMLHFYWRCWTLLVFKQP